MDLNEFSRSLHLDPKTVERLSQSADGQRLMALLQQKGAELDHAAKAGENGSYGEMAALMKQVMGSAEGRMLLQRLAKQLKHP